MFPTLTYTNSRGEALTFAVGADFHVNISRDVTGLSDVEATISTTSTIGMDGGLWTSSVIRERTIHIRGAIKARDAQRQGELRRELAHVLDPHLDGSLRYTLGAFSRVIACRPETAPQVTQSSSWPAFDISLRCPSPYWRETAISQDVISGWSSELVFPLPKFGTDTPQEWPIILGARSSETIVTITNEGDVDCGLKVTFHASGAVTNPSLLNYATNERLKILTTLAEGDELTVTTGYGSKTVTKNGENLFRALDPDSVFLQLAVGDNLFKVEADSGLSALEASIEFEPAYLAV